MFQSNKITQTRKNPTVSSDCSTKTAGCWLVDGTITCGPTRKNSFSFKRENGGKRKEKSLKHLISSRCINSSSQNVVKSSTIRWHCLIKSFILARYKLILKWNLVRYFSSVYFATKVVIGVIHLNGSWCVCTRLRIWCFICYG